MSQAADVTPPHPPAAITSQELPPLVFAKVFEQELIKLEERRSIAGFSQELTGNGSDTKTRRSLVGLALSGGGIRSATFCLGLLQGLNHLGLLRVFDYLSTVSGGGYVGGWWSAWLARPQFSLADLKHTCLFIARLLDPDDPVSRHLLQRFTPELRRLIDAAGHRQEQEARDRVCPPQSPAPVGDLLPASQLAALQERLIIELNQVIAGECLCDKTRFPKNSLQETSQELLAAYRQTKHSQQLVAKINKIITSSDEDIGRLIWLNRQLLEDVYAGLLVQAIFPPAERIEPERARNYLPERSPASVGDAPGDCDLADEFKIAEGSIFAGIDPLHHLRLFASYLTPRRGLLSNDTWRMITVITRNLMMTWLILLPVLAAIVLVGQLYFVLQPGVRDDFLYYPSKNLTRPWTMPPHRASALPQETPLSDAEAHRLHNEAFRARLRAAAKPLLLIAGWMALMGCLWLVCTINKEGLAEWAVVIAGLVGVAAVAFCVMLPYQLSHLLPGVFTGPISTTIGSWFFAASVWVDIWIIGAVVLITYVLWRPAESPFDADKESRRQWRMEVRANKITSVHAQLFVAFVGTALVLALSGFGHEVILYPTSFFAPEHGVLEALTRNIGWFGLFAAALAGSIITIYITRPTADDDKQAKHELSAKSRFVLAITPGLVVIALAVAVAWVDWQVLSGLAVRIDKANAKFISDMWETWQGTVPNGQPHVDALDALTYAAFFSIVLCFALALFEIKWQARPTVGLLFGVTVLAFTISLVSRELFTRSAPPLVIALAGVVAVLTAIVLIKRFSTIIKKQAEEAAAGPSEWRVFQTGNSDNLFFWVLILTCAIIAGVLCFKMKDVLHLGASDRDPAAWAGQGWFVILPLIAVTASGGLLLFRLLVRRTGQEIHFGVSLRSQLAQKRRRDVLYLLAAICLVLVVLTDCSLHALIKHGTLLEPDSLSFLFLPVSIALMAITTFVLRVGAEEIESAGATRLRLLVWLRGLAERLERFLAARLGQHKDRVLLGLMTFSLLATLSYGVLAGWQHRHTPSWQSVFALRLVPVYLLTAGLFGLAMAGLRSADGARHMTMRLFTRQWIANHRLATLVGLAAFSILLAWVTGFGFYDVLTNAIEEYQNETNPIRPTSPVVVGIIICATFVIFEIKWGAGNNRRPLWLFTAAYVILVALCIINLSTGKAVEALFQSQLAQAVIGLVAAALAWVVGLGWMADPNAYSMHLFYKARLVRAYLGASNYNRRKQRKEITEAVAGDNVLIKEMRNCNRGAPYHLINTTLNLVAARDLATAQRSAASFVLSQFACGSSRTGYRKTKKYMEGRLSLGTAMAVSGAAASPNMGSRTPSTALAMLMTILNVRLGYWAPTPHRRDWQSPRTRLWPFYLLREFLSGTNDVSDHCYLTDGGHFDNTGLYSLVERGCRYIVVVDCGADPNSSFNDLGNAIRRCRIDFDAEINLNIAAFEKLKSNHATSHFVEGSICYSPAHLRTLNGRNGAAEKRLGRIILVKPSLLADNGNETADVRQYSIQNEDFPQQTTANQWFDEAQFESYRRLGRICTESLFGSLDQIDNPGPNVDEPTRKRREAVKRIKQDAYRIQFEDIRDLFKDPSQEPLV